ncbi:MAG: hypothetical protein M0P52_09655 [Rhodoferax sp.]|nr:hypothetical protein [Rhodoferax sp.]
MHFQKPYGSRFTSSILIQKTYGKLMLVVVLMLVTALQLDSNVHHFFGQAVCLVVGMVLVKLAHCAHQSGIGKARQIECEVKQRNRARDAYQEKTARVLRRAAIARAVAQSSVLWSAIKAIVATELRVRSIVKSVLCTVTETLTPRLFPCPPAASA